MLRASFALLVLALGGGAQPNKDFRFEVLSIRPVQLAAGSPQGIANPTPNGFRTTASLWQMVVAAYAPPMPAWMWVSVKIANQPSWFSQDFFAIDARVSRADLQAWQRQGADHELLRAALRTLLRERCKLAIHEQPSKERIYELVVAKGGPKLKASPPGAAVPVGFKLHSGAVLTYQGKDDWNFHGATMEDLAQQLGFVSGGIPVRHKTGLTGRYDFTVRRVQAPDEDRVYTYPVEPLGLRLKSGAENRPILVIDHVERPAPN